MRKSVTHFCSVCTESRKSRSREFSSGAWLALATWGEVANASVGQPICEHCYRELRDLLIERTDELERISAAQNDFAAVCEMPAFAAKEATGSQIAS